jgi:hypothetical protein
VTCPGSSVQILFGEATPRSYHFLFSTFQIDTLLQVTESFAQRWWLHKLVFCVNVVLIAGASQLVC